jgi:hypothetical protein
MHNKHNNFRLGERGQMGNWLWLVIVCTIIYIVYITLNEFMTVDLNKKLLDKMSFDTTKANATAYQGIGRTQTTWNWLPWAVPVAVFFCGLYAAFTVIGGVIGGQR